MTVFGYDALGRPASVSNPAIQAMPLVQRAYTADGLTASLTIARSNSVFNVTNFAYDGFDRLATTTYPDTSTEVLGYDADNNVLTRQTRAGPTITYTYDTLNRLSTWVVAKFAVLIQVVEGGHPEQQIQPAESFSCAVELDINTAPDVRGPLPHEDLPRIFAELVDAGLQIATRGDARP